MENLLEHFRDIMTGAPPDRETSPRGAAAEAPPADSAASDENAQLIKLLDEVTHSIRLEDDAEAQAERSTGGFVVEESPFARAGSFPPVYNAAAAPGNVFAFAKPPPPSFAEAIATTPPMTTARAELSTLAARYIPPMPAAQQETIIVRNDQGVFLLQPITKPTPPYTPPSVSPPISPLPRYALPPPAQPQPHFLGSSVALASEGDAQQALRPSQSPPSLGPASHAGGPGGARTYTFSSTAVKAGYTPPPPYPA